MPYDYDGTNEDEFWEDFAPDDWFDDEDIAEDWYCGEDVMDDWEYDYWED